MNKDIFLLEIAIFILLMTGIFTLFFKGVFFIFVFMVCMFFALSYNIISIIIKQNLINNLDKKMITILNDMVKADIKFQLKIKKHVINQNNEIKILEQRINYLEDKITK